MIHQEVRLSLCALRLEKISNTLSLEDDVELKTTLFLVNMSQKRQNGFAADSVCFAGLSVCA